MSKYYFLYDVGPQSRLEWLASAFSGEEVVWLEMRYDEKNRIYKIRKPLHLLCYLELALKSVLKSMRGDYLISWNFNVGVFVAIICKLFRVERTILSLNMISHSGQWLMTRVKRKLYNYAFSYKGFIFTVNSKDTLLAYSQEFKINENKVTILSDPFLRIYKEKSFEYQDSYIFCGGEAQRDWLTFFNAAYLLHDYNFVGVARKKYLPKKLTIPDNVTMYYDIMESSFDALLEKASIVTLPLLSQMPAGLIVILKSIFLSIPLIVTRTPPVESYLQDEETAILIAKGDAQALANAIIRIRDNKRSAEIRTLKARKYIEKYSPERYSQTLYQILCNCGKT
jgi:glycosyltransferase involved in cell wall biosynthesis